MLRPTIIAAGLLAISLTAVGAQSSDHVRPGDDFFAYANGDWLSAAELPPGMNRWTARNEINELARQQVERLLDDALNAPAGVAGAEGRRFPRRLTQPCRHRVEGDPAPRPPARQHHPAARQGGSGPVPRARRRRRRRPAQLGMYRSSHVLGLSVEPGIRGERTPVAFLLQGGLGLPDREPYLNPEPGKVSLRARYEQYIARLLALAGFGHGTERAGRSSRLEVAPRADAGQR